MASVVVLENFVNLHYNRGVAGVCNVDRFNNSSQVRFARRPPAFDVVCNLHSQIHKYSLHSVLKNVDSNVLDVSDIIPLSRQCQILRQPGDFLLLLPSHIFLSSLFWSYASQLACWYRIGPGLNIAQYLLGPTVSPAVVSHMPLDPVSLVAVSSTVCEAS